MALMFEKVIAAAVVIGLGSGTALGAFPVVVFNAAALTFSKLTAPFLNDGEDVLDVGARVSVVFMTFIGTVLQLEDVQAITWIQTLSMVVLFGNSLWSMVMFVYSMDPIGIYRQFKAFYEKNRAMAEFGRLTPENIKDKTFERKCDVAVSKSELNAATNPRSIHKALGFELADEGGRRLGTISKKNIEGGTPAVIVTTVDNRSAAYTSGVRQGMVLTHFEVVSFDSEGDEQTKIIPLAGLSCDQVDKKLIELQKEPASRAKGKEGNAPKDSVNVTL